jgi:peptidoglycan/xylan/chitin deacetylase (PgdA/CDA1 family)
MRLALLATLMLALAAGAPAAAQTAFAWPKGKRAAIVLTYDDAMPSQLAVAIPQLDAAGLKGTFFLDADSLTPAEILRWRGAARRGHELGNHS